VGAPAIQAARSLGLRVAVNADNFSDTEIIYRLARPPYEPGKYQYLLVSENVDDAPRVDVLSLKNFARAKDRLKKKKAGAGIEITVAPARKMDAAGVAKWVSDAGDLYQFCRSSGFQFILSSGADSPAGAVSGQSLDALLKMMGVDPQRHWQDLEKWLESRLERRVRRR
jgi:hypothetical protein